MYETKDYYEAVIKALVEKLSLKEWELKNAEERNRKLNAELTQLKEIYKEQEVNE